MIKLVTYSDKQCDIGVLIGRFQTPKLHEAHVNLIQTVCGFHKRVIVLLGVSKAMPSAQNPLGFEARKQMIQEAFPQVTILPLSDTKYDEVWVKDVEAKVREIVPVGDVMLYGGRDSFLTCYWDNGGKWPTTEVQQEVYISGSMLRKQAAAEVMNNEAFRAGVVFAVSNRFPINFATIDVCIYDAPQRRILMAKKPIDKNYRFVGGFADPTDNSYEFTVIREVLEETHLTVSNPVYLTSRSVKDWRYRNSTDKIKTLFFIVNYEGGVPEPDDDISELRWFNIDEITRDQVEGEHKYLYDFLQEYFDKKAFEASNKKV